MRSPAINALGVDLTIPFEDMGEQALVERWPPNDTPTADVWFKCNWVDRYTVVRYLRGGMVRSGKTISYLRPASYPDSPNLLCTGLNEIHGRKPRVYQAGAALPGWVYYEFAYIHAHFSVPTWDAVGMTPQDPSGIPMTTTKYRASTEIFAPPLGSYKYAAGAHSGKPVTESGVGIVWSRAEISMTRHLLPYPYLSDVMAHDGKVNQEVVTFADMDFPAGCVLFTGADMEPTANPADGSRCWDMTFTFLANFDTSWNEVMDPDGVFVTIDDGAGNPPFEELDFSAFFSNVI